MASLKPSSESFLSEEHFDFKAFDTIVGVNEEVVVIVDDELVIEFIIRGYLLFIAKAFFVITSEVIQISSQDCQMMELTAAMVKLGFVANQLSFRVSFKEFISLIKSTEEDNSC